MLRQLLLLACCLLICSARANEDWKIVVGFGPFKSAAEAEASYKTVNFHDGDTSDDTRCTEAFAALELRRYLCRLTVRDESDPAAFSIIGARGSPPPRAIRLTTAQPAGTAAHYRITSSDTLITLAGDDRIGTLYAVYDLLDRLGVRWYAPGDMGEKVPHLAALNIPTLNVTAQPAFLTRGFWAWEDRADEDFIRWMARNRLNQWTSAYRDPQRLRQLGIIATGGGHQPMPRCLNPTHVFPYNVDPYPRSEGSGDTNHDGKLTYFEAHPEWFGLQDGKRSAEINREFGDNLCTSNPDAVAEFCTNLITELATGEWHNADRLHLFMLDMGRWCTCDKCAELGNPNDRNILLVHQVHKAIVAARAAGQLSRDISIVFSCYTGYLDAPTRPLPPDFDYAHCIAGFYPIRRCFAHNLADDNCQEFNAVVRGKLSAWFLAPEHRYNGPFYIGEYYNIGRNKSLPAGFSRSMAADIPYYYRSGARHMDYMHVPHASWGTRSLVNWQFARMLWDPALDVGALKQDYFAGRYGASAMEMEQFYNLLETALSSSKFLKTRLAGALASGSAELFPSRHLSFDDIGRDPAQSGPTLVESLAALNAARAILNRTPSPFPDDAIGFAYAENTLNLYHALVLTDRAVRSGHDDEARAHLARAETCAARLKAEVNWTHSASAHANAPDGLDASGVEPALAHLRQRLAPSTQP